MRSVASTAAVSARRRQRPDLIDALEHVDPIGAGIDAMQAAGDDQTLQDAGVLGADFSPAEQPGLAAL